MVLKTSVNVGGGGVDCSTKSQFTAKFRQESFINLQEYCKFRHFSDEFKNCFIFNLRINYVMLVEEIPLYKGNNRKIWQRFVKAFKASNYKEFGGLSNSLRKFIESGKHTQNFIQKKNTHHTYSFCIFTACVKGVGYGI